MNMLIQWRDNLTKLAQEGTITNEQAKKLKELNKKIKELGL